MAEMRPGVCCSCGKPYHDDSLLCEVCHWEAVEDIERCDGLTEEEQTDLVHEAGLHQDDELDWLEAYGGEDPADDLDHS